MSSVTTMKRRKSKPTKKSTSVKRSKPAKRMKRGSIDLRTRKLKKATTKSVLNNDEGFDTVVAIQNGVSYMGHGGGVSAQTARDAFKKKYGVAPETVFRYKQLVLAGPAPV